MHLLGRIDQQKEKRERARRDGCDVERKPRCFVDQSIEIARAGSAPAPRLACSSQVIDDAVGLVALEASNDAAKPRGQKTNIVMKRDVLRARVGITRPRGLSFSRGRVRLG